MGACRRTAVELGGSAPLAPRTIPAPDLPLPSLRERSSWARHARACRRSHSSGVGGGETPWTPAARVFAGQGGCRGAWVRNDDFFLRTFCPSRYQGRPAVTRPGSDRRVSQARVSVLTSSSGVLRSSVPGGGWSQTVACQSLAGGPMKVAGEVGQSAAAGAPARAGSRDGTPVSPATPLRGSRPDDPGLLPTRWRRGGRAADGTSANPSGRAIGVALMAGDAPLGLRPSALGPRPSTS